MSEHEIPVDEMETAEGLSWTEEIIATGDDVMRIVGDLVREANVRRVTVVTAGGKKLLDLPLYASTLGVILLGPLTALPLALALLTQCSIVVERRGDAPAATGAESVAEDTIDIPVEMADEAEIATDPDKLTAIKGIGPKVEALLNEAGIFSYAQLGAADVEALQQILDAAGSRYRIIDPTEWPAQANALA